MNALTFASILIFVVALCIGVCAMAFYLYTEPYQETFAPGTFVSGHAMAGLTAEEGMSFVQLLTAEAIDNWRFTVDFEGTQYVLTGRDVGLSVDLNATLDALWQRGKGGLLSAGLDMIKLKHEPMEVFPVAAYDLTGADTMLKQLREDIECPPVDATVRFLPGHSEPFQFTSEQVGMQLDIAPLQDAIERALQSFQSGSIQAEPTMLLPSVYKEQLEAATTLRAQVRFELEADEFGFINATIAAQALNGAVIEPGESLSFNDVVGVRTTDKGYVNALEPAYGEGIEGVGGGVCQTASALYQAALLGCVEVEERNAAVRPVSYCDMGQEAAVSEQGLDLVLRNSGDSRIFVSARTYRSDSPMIEVQLFGEPLDAWYALETHVQEIAAPEEPIYVQDTEGLYALYQNESVTVSTAMPGYSVVLERIALDTDGNEIERETVYEGEYAPVPQIIYVGIQ